MKSLKIMSFGTLAVITLILMAASIAEHLWGTEVARNCLYTAPWVLVLWGVCAIASAVLVWRGRRRMGYGGVLIHLALIGMLCGALTTHLTAVTGQVELTSGDESLNTFTEPDGNIGHFPFGIKLLSNSTVYYPGTQTPMDYVSLVEITDEEGASTEGRISMNQILVHDGWRFYQKAMGSDFSVLTVNHDPWGIGITYTGYTLLLIGIILFFFQKQSGFRQALTHKAWQKAALTTAILLGTAQFAAASEPETLQRGVAKTFGQLYVYHNGRVQPMQTLARNFCVKLYGKPSYKGLTAEQVLTGWLFYYDEWKNEPMIRVKDEGMQQLLGLQGEYARLTDFYDTNGYKLDAVQSEERNRTWQETNEKCKLAGLMFTGRGLLIFPYSDDGGETTQWYSWVDDLPMQMPVDDKRFILGCMDYVAQCLQNGRNIEANNTLTKIKEYQEEKASAHALPTPLRFEAELLYNKIAHTRPVAIVCLIMGFCFYFLSLRSLIADRRLPRWCVIGQSLTLALVGCWLLTLLSLRGYIGGYAPFTNGFETMLLMGLFAAFGGVAFQQKMPLVQPFGLILCGLTILVAMMGDSNPAVTPLMPVLSSPLLSIHVVVIMISYALLAIMALNGGTACLIALLRKRGMAAPAKNPEFMLSLVNRLLLYPALLLLALGIFIGAVWANQSWGAYWSWDPKETWALITLFIYSFPLHSRSMAAFSRPSLFNLYCFIAFASVLMTYLGVNYLLGGMHSYA